MQERYKSYHIVTVLIFVFLMICAVFITDNPLVLTGIVIVCLSVLLSSGCSEKLTRGMHYFLPFSLVIVFINFIFTGEGKIILFSAFGRNFTLESLIYALILASKLLIVTYTFMICEVMIDSDKASSYFSSILPKSALTLMIAFKLFPSMRERLSRLREIYSLRGVNFDGKSTKDKIKSYLPILSILMETSLEGAFDIGEAAYVRGFLSGKRTVYDRQKLKKRDYFMVFSALVFVSGFLVLKLYRLDNINIYEGMEVSGFINSGAIVSFITTIQMGFSIYWVNNLCSRD